VAVAVAAVAVAVAVVGSQNGAAGALMMAVGGAGVVAVEHKLQGEGSG
jgi:hypothetical protein